MSAESESKDVDQKKPEVQKVPGCSLTASEDKFGKTMEYCIANTAVKTVAGFTIGALFSFVLFKRRPWPMIAGTSFGFGLGMGNCKNGFEGCSKKPCPITGSRGSCPIKKSTDVDQVALADVKKE